jgi:hypothetical protein
VVKRCSKNDFTHHPTPYMACHICHGNMTIVSKMGPTIVVGSAKAKGSKAKPVNRSEPPRATRARDEVTQRMANISAHPVAHHGVPASSSFVSESRPGGFLHALCGLASRCLGFFAWITLERSLKPHIPYLMCGGGISLCLILWRGTCLADSDP